MDDKFEYKIINGVENEISYYHFKIDEDVFLCRVQQEMVTGDCEFDIATTAQDYADEDVFLDDDTMIYKDEFNVLYKKYKDLFEIDTF